MSYESIARFVNNVMIANSKALLFHVESYVLFLARFAIVHRDAEDKTITIS